MSRKCATHIAGVLSGVAMAVALAGCASAPSATELQEAGRGPLDREQMQALMGDGLEAAWSRPGGESGTVTFHPDGTGKAAWDGGSTEGTWRLEADGTICSAWEAQGNEEQCVRLYEGDSEGVYLVYDDGDHTARWEVLETTASR